MANMNYPGEEEEPLPDVPSDLPDFPGERFEKGQSDDIDCVNTGDE